MKSFTVIEPRDVEAAARLASAPGATAFAGGIDVLDLAKQRIVEPDTLINVKSVADLQGITVKTDGSIRIGAATKLAEVAAHLDMRVRFTCVAEAASEAATPQVRNLATVGGNLMQRPRCWYFRHPDVRCLKKGGDKCYSIGGLNRYHAILGGGPSFIAHPSNLAPALVAMNARAIVYRAGAAPNVRMIEMEKFFALPSVDPSRENVLGHGDLIQAIEIPAPPAGAFSAYLEAREKQSFDWPLVSAAVMIEGGGARNAARDARVVMGAVAPIPWRSRDAEAVLRAGAFDESRARAAAEAALTGAQAMSDNGYKVPLAKVIVRRAIMRAAGA
jgi:xanthine dehydrogenase YagS FAD-binding subunit